MTFGKEMKEAMDRAAANAGGDRSYLQLPEIAIEALKNGCETVKEIKRYSRQHGQPFSDGRYLSQRLRNDPRVEVAEEAGNNRLARYRLKTNQSP